MRIRSHFTAVCLTAALLPLAPSYMVRADATTPTRAPASVLSSMKKGGISLRYEKLPLKANGAPVIAHVYTVPAGRITGSNPYYGGTIPRAGSPFKRSDIAPGPSSLITDSPFYLDLFAPASKSGQLKRINSVRFTESRDINGITTRYLQPKTKSGPMLLLGFSSLSTYDITVATFPKGLKAPASVDRFSGGGAGGGGVQLSFEGVDSRGFTTVEKKPYTKIYNDQYERFPWNGTHFRKVAGATEPAEPRVLTRADSGSDITLQAGKILVVRLPDMSSSGYLWSLVEHPDMPVKVVTQQRIRGNAAPGVVEAPGIHEWTFVATAASFGRRSYLKLLQLRPFEPGITNAELWEVRLSIPASK